MLSQGINASTEQYIYANRRRKEKRKMERKKISAGLIASILFCLLLIVDVRSIASVSPEIQDSSLSQVPRSRSIASQELAINSRCGTMTILKNLSENRKKLGVQYETKTFSSRPTDPGGGIDGNQHLLPKLYNTNRFVFHWTNGTDGGSSEDVPLPNTDDNGNGIPDVVENWGEISEYVWDFLVNTKGFPAPPSDASESNDARNRNPDGRYDVFLYDFEYFGYAYPEQWPNSPSYSYVGLRRSLGFLALRQAVAAHEFFHAIQFVYDCTEESWWMEASASWVEDEVFPDSNDNYGKLLGWFPFSDTYGLEYANGWHEYGTFIFAKHLSEEFGDEIIKEIWTEMIQTNGLVAVINVLVDKNSSLINEFSNFTTANFFLEDSYVDGSDYREFITGKTTFNGVWLEYQYDAAIAPNYLEINSSNVNKDAWMDKWATDYLTLKLDPAKSKYRISFDGLDLTTSYLVKLATKKEGVINETMFNLDGQKDGYLDLSYDTFDNATLIIANAGNTATTNPSWRVTVEILETIPIYDVAVIDIKPSTYSAVTEQTINVAVTVKNKGNTRDESFNVSTWWGEFLIEEKSVTNLSRGAEKTLNITWNIPDELNGSKTLWANATIVPEEIDVENNEFEDGILSLTIGIHDLAVINVTLSKTIIVQGGNLNINVTVTNQGNYTEAFGLTAFANTTVIQIQTVTLESGTSTILAFTWDTTGWALGNYTMSANASIRPQEIDTADNSYVDGTVTVRPPIHDITVTDIALSKTVVGQGYSTYVNVTSANQGDCPETFNVTAYVNATIIGSKNVMLSAGNTAKLTFIWDTTGFSYGNYTLSVVADSVSGETNVSDNTRIAGMVHVGVPGDVTGDHYGGIDDIFQIATHFGQEPWHPFWNAIYDIAGDNYVGVDDIFIAASHFGEQENP